MLQQNQKTNDVQIILLTGYLGAGKTTLIQYILRSQNEYRVAVIQNEFADEMGIEAPLMQDAEGKPFDKFYELPNGCICCTAKGDLLIAVEYFIKCQSLDYILIETNGLADPSATIQQFWVDEELKFPAELRAVHAVVPTHRFMDLWSNEMFKKQIVYADTVLLNYMVSYQIIFYFKQDKCENDEQKQDVIRKIKQINPTCQIEEASYCHFPLKLLFEHSKSQRSEILDIQDHIHSDQDINHVLVQEELPIREQYEWERIIGTFLWEEELGILRIKGILKVREAESFIHSLQGVNDTFEIVKTERKWEDLRDKRCKILIIGKNIDKVKILSYFLNH